ncbi:MAG: tetratricopeptide repeat protein, partial [Bacteroidota bacterium]
FQKLGEAHYKSGNFEKAFRAFEHAIKVTESPVVTAEPDPNLIYNTALSAYQSENLRKAIAYFDRLNKDHFSSHIPHLLSTIYLKQEDTVTAREVLIQGIDSYKENEDLILLLADLYYNSNDIKDAINTLEVASENADTSYIFLYTMGVIYQKDEQYKKAIEAYEKALSRAKDSNEFEIYKNMGISYYNIGVEIQQKARRIINRQDYQKEKEKAAAALKSAVNAFEKAYEENPENPEVITRLNQLYDFLNIDERITALDR